MLPSRPLAVTFVLSVTFGSYLSKSLGKLTTGVLMSFKLPFPLTTTRNVNGSLALISVLFSCALMLNTPTPPENVAGLAGRGNTFSVIPGATMSRFTSTYADPPLKKASTGSTSLFCCTTDPLNTMLGIFNAPDI